MTEGTIIQGVQSVQLHTVGWLMARMSLCADLVACVLRWSGH